LDLLNNNTKSSSRTFSVGYETDYDDPASLEHKVSVDYSMGATGLALGLTAAGEQNPRSWAGMQIEDPFLQLSTKHYKIGKRVRTWGELRTYFPASAQSQDKGLLIGIRSSQTISYSIGGRWKFGHKTMLRWNSYGDTSKYYLRALLKVNVVSGPKLRLKA
jgi:hypothetical protein